MGQQARKSRSNKVLNYVFPVSLSLSFFLFFPLSFYLSFLSLQYKHIMINQEINIIVFVTGWLGDMINKVSRNPIVHIIPIIKIRRILSLSTMGLSFLGSALGMSMNIQLDEGIRQAECRNKKVCEKLKNDFFFAWRCIYDQVSIYQFEKQGSTSNSQSIL